MSIPVVVLKGEPRSGFVQLWKTNPVVRFNVLASGLWFYGYNELATMTIKKTSAVTQSVANTAKRVIVIVGVAIVMGESSRSPQAGRLRHRHRRRLPLSVRPARREGRRAAGGVTNDGLMGSTPGTTAPRRS